ncbi:MAG: PQQ-binding-like beta-propeller repeat protein [Bacteroidia bacterium]|nr:PQQ-binding-like beta-propeller repeat protein [Bacteroidia bacterium]
MLKRNSVIIGATVAVFAIVFSWWVLSSPSYDVVVRVPGMDNRPPQKQISDSIYIGQNFDTLGIIDEVVSGSWPRFRGADIDNISKDPTPLAETWDTSGPPVVWQVTLGEGYAGPAVHNGRVYVLDYNEKRKADMLRCFSLKSGTELWRRWYTVEFKRNHGYSRTIPAVTDKYLVTVGPRSHVMCMNPLNGDLLWTIDMEREYGIHGTVKGKITPEFYSGQCPLIDNDIAVFAPGGKALMIGVDCATGKVLWKTPNPDSLRMSHTSVIPMNILGKKMYVYAALGGVCGVSAEGDDTGKLLWKTTEWSPSITVASPLYLGNGEIAAFGSYGAGTAKIMITRDESGFKAVVAAQHKSSGGIASEQHTPIMVGDNLWAVLPENAGALKRQLACYNKSNLITPVWSSGKEGRFGKGMGPFIMSGNKLYLLDDEGTLYLFKIDKSSATLIANHKIIQAIEAWSPMAMAGKYLIMRDAHKMLCLDISKKE